MFNLINSIQLKFFRIYLISAILVTAPIHGISANQITSKMTRDPFNFTSALTGSQPSSAFLLKCIPIHYAKISELVKFIQHDTLHLLSKKGSVKADVRTQQLWVHDDAMHIKRLKRLISKLDVAVPQILIKAKILTIDENYLKYLGVAFTQTAPSTNHESSASSRNLDEFNQIPIIRLNNNHFINVRLDALIQNGHANIMAEPQLFTMDHQTASIESGEEIPYQQTSLSGGTSAVFKKAVLALKVTPDILPNNKILLHIQVSQDTLSSLDVNGVPAITTQHLNTEVLLSNRATVVLGGITNKTTTTTDTGVPLLKDIPLLGKLFQSHRSYSKKSELLLLVTPTIIK